jgi:hypothetical protein
MNSQFLVNVARGLMAILLAIWANLAAAQVIIINVNEEHPHRLPRPIIVHPHPHPHPIPVPVMEYKIKELTVEAKLDRQVAKVQVSQSFVNTGNRVMEVCFVFPLPYDGAVDRLTLMVDGREYEAKLMDAPAARALYESILPGPAGRGAQGLAALHAGLPQHERADRFSVPDEHGQVHGAPRRDRQRPHRRRERRGH